MRGQSYLDIGIIACANYLGGGASNDNAVQTYIYLLAGKILFILLSVPFFKKGLFISPFISPSYKITHKKCKNIIYGF
jgi:hypothetical protein